MIPVSVRTDQSELADRSAKSSRVVALIAIGFFVTTIGQPAQVGGLPLRLLLKDYLHTTASDLAAFFAIAAIAWYAKPVAGLLCDSVPIFGSRRRSYLLLSIAISMVLWICLGYVSPSYSRLLWLVIALNTTIVIASTVLGAVMVEAGRQNQITGQLVSWKFVANNVAALLVGPLAGFLASRPFVIAGWTGALILLPLGFLGAVALRSERMVGIGKESIDALKEIKQLITNRSLILATSFIFLVGIQPGFDTPLLYYQTDKLNFSPKFLGWLALARGVTGLAAAALYGFLCSRLTLRRLLIIGVLLHVCDSLVFLSYTSPTTAVLIEAIYGFSYTLAVLPIFDLAARATPKGCEAMGLAAVMSLWNVANAVSDIVGSWLFDKYAVTFMSLLWLNAVTTLSVLPFVRLLPKNVVESKSAKNDVGWTEV
jgi:predicted MFS family arabinose efflux permease